MATRYNYTGKLVTDGLVLNLDAAKRDSYPGSGTTWYDLSGNGNNGTLTNGPTYTGVSKDAAIVFDGVDDYVRILGSSTDFAFDNVGATFNLWIYPTSYQSLPLVKRNISIGWEIQIDSSGYISWYFQSSGGTFFDTADGTPVTLNQWNNITVVLDRNTNIVSRYLNATLTGTNTDITGLTGLSDNSTDVSIGGRYARNDQYLNGKVPTVQIYNRALSQTEITQNFNALRGRYGI